VQLFQREDFDCPDSVVVEFTATLVFNSVSIIARCEFNFHHFNSNLCEKFVSELRHLLMVFCWYSVFHLFLITVETSRKVILWQPFMACFGSSADKFDFTPTM
jgi:hypothetical protein